jgi:tetratricopeptide (TPR) repeat protein
VYTVDSVGEFLNKEFISVKVQMDQTKNDNAEVRSWYKTASDISNRYSISAYPSFVFFTPSGEIATKEVGYKDAPTFISVAKDAKDPSKQYYVLLKNYKKGKLNDAGKRSLIITAKQLNDSANYHALRTSYFTYLHALPKEKLYTKDNIEFIARFISRRSQPVFDMFYPDGSAVDKVMDKKGYARKVVDDVIMKEKLAPVLNPALESKKEPDWNSLYNSIAKEYNADYANRSLMEAKMIWYYDADDYLKWTTLLNDKIEKFGTDTSTCSGLGTLSNLSSIILDRVGATARPDDASIKELSRVANWMSVVVRKTEFLKGEWCYGHWTFYICNYSNLLHKTGNTTEAIKWMELALEKLPETIQDEKEQESYRKLYQNDLDNMRKGLPTWPVKE